MAKAKLINGEMFLLMISEEDACKEGTAWVRRWVRQNPNTPISQFFLSKTEVKTEHWAYCPHGYLRWAFSRMLDWSEVQGKGQFRLGFWPNDRVEDFLLKNWGHTSLSGITPKQLALALAQAYSGE